MKHVGIKQARQELPDLIDRAEAGEEIMITRQGKPVAKLVGVPKTLKALPSLTQFRTEIGRTGTPAGTVAARRTQCPVKQAMSTRVSLAPTTVPNLSAARPKPHYGKLKLPVISLFSEVEFCSLLWRKRRLKELTEGQMSAWFSTSSVPMPRRVLTAAQSLTSRTFPHCSQG